MNNYEEACNYISGIPKFAPKTELANTRTLLAALGNPQEKYKSLHVAGTNGKGSVCKMLSLMLQNEGHKVGLFISPHLIRMNERMSVNGCDISDEDFVEEFQTIHEISEKLKTSGTEKESGAGAPFDLEVPAFAHPAYFEFLFAMAADYFAKQGCDYVVWETGLGGRLDATNTVIPEVSVITSIGMDHMQYLGNTIEEIAGEKAGIIKPGIPVIYNTGSAEADKVIEAVAAKQGSRAIRVPDFAETFPDDIKDAIETFADGNPASYQRDNAETAVTAYIILKEQESADCTEKADGFKTSGLGQIASSALTAFSWPGRMQFIDENFVIDGAHNEDAAKRFVESVQELLTGDSGSRRKWSKVSLVFAVSSDKDYEEIIRILCENLPLEDVYVTELHSERKTDPARIIELFQKYRPAGEYWDNYGTTDIKKAIEYARGERADDTLLAAVGSLYMVGEILQGQDCTEG